MRDFLKQYLLSRVFVERLVSIIGMIIIVIVAQDFAVFFLTAFLCAYLFHEAAQWSQSHLHTLAKNSPKQFRESILWLSNTKVLLTTLYLFFAFICIFAIRDIGPTLTSDMINLLSSLSERFSIDLGISGLQDTLSKWQTLSYQIGDFVNVISPSTDTNTILSEFLRISGIFFQILFAYILSFIWLLEYEKVQTYFSQLKKGPFAFFYRDVQIILEKIQKSFGLVFRAQSKIAVANTVLTVIGLIIIGLFYGQLSLNGSYIFPYLLALGCITFFTSFVPILGVFIGGIPILFAGVVEYPGWSIVVTIITMLFIIHAFEGYFLNPRIVGQSLKVPTPVVFLILFIAEHFMGIIGFFIGVPIYLLLTELFVSIGHMVEKIQKPS
ncbi:AI-2E family transporter [Candidatus Gracilibacteria bacterium]|nr:AI-2E family transporter [Candidatus Gracilibacteria bacterium]